MAHDPNPQRCIECPLEPDSECACPWPANIAAVRRKHALRQVELARFLECDPRSVRRWEAGKTAATGTSAAVIRALMKARPMPAVLKNSRISAVLMLALMRPEDR